MILSIQSPRFQSSSVLIGAAALGLGAATQGILDTVDAPVFRGAWILGAVVWAAGWFVFGAIALSLAYPRVDFDPESGLVRAGLKTIPASQIVRATRRLSASAQASYLTYTLRTESGISLRLLVVGTPMRGMTPEQLVNLATLIPATRITAPVPAATSDDGPPLSVEQQRVAANLVPSGGAKVDMSREALLFELLGEEAGVLPATADASTTIAPPAGLSAESAGVPADLPAPAISGARLTGPEMAALAADWEADDRSSVQAVLALPHGPTQRRRIAFWAVVGVILLGALALVVLVIQESSRAEVIDEDILTIVFAASLLLSVVTYALWCVAADRQVAQVRSAGRAWLAERSADAAQRGLPEVFHSAWLQPAPGHRMLTLLSFAGAVIGLGAAIGGPIVMATTDLALPLGLPLLLGGLLLLGLASWFLVAYLRRRRRDAEELVLLAGWRATPPRLRGE